MQRLRNLVLLLAFAGLTSSCAVTTPGVAPGPSRSMPVARAALLPEYRIFYDTLQEYGDWVLIEPYGYLFRPRNDHHSWRPYEQGFWAPSDNFGWVWISSEPYGWATYHYGRWFYDDFQGWVWRPGPEWAPAWVSWTGNDRYVGWSPLGPGSRPLASGSGPPGGAYTYTAVGDLGTTNPRLMRAAELGTAVAELEQETRTVTVDGVAVPAGPSIERVERLAGRRLVRTRVEDLIERRAAGPAPGEARAPDAVDPPKANLDQARRAGVEAARDARWFQSRRDAPSRISVVRPAILPPPPARDSAGTRPGR